MTVTAIEKDPRALSLTITAEFAASPERVWRLWEDPRQLEQWWGPPGFPATFTEHDLRVGGRMAYHLTGPTRRRPMGWWEVVEAQPPRRLVLTNGFANTDGTPNDALPRTTMRVTIAPAGEGRTSMRIQTQFPSEDAMARLVSMGMESGLRDAIGQIDAILEVGSATTRDAAASD
jgi:uncharacterized protein YndB with AHSA1/START domain